MTRLPAPTVVPGKRVADGMVAVAPSTTVMLLASMRPFVPVKRPVEGPATGAPELPLGTSALTQRFWRKNRYAAPRKFDEIGMLTCLIAWSAGGGEGRTKLGAPGPRRFGAPPEMSQRAVGVPTGFPLMSVLTKLTFGLPAPVGMIKKRVGAAKSPPTQL